MTLSSLSTIALLTERRVPATPPSADAAFLASEIDDVNPSADADAALKAFVALLPAAVTDDPRFFAAVDTELIDEAAVLLEAEKATPNVFDAVLIAVMVLSVCASVLFKLAMLPRPVTLMAIPILIGTEAMTLPRHP